MPDGMTLGGMTHTGESVGHMHGMVIGDVPVGPAVDMSAVNSVEYPPSSTEPFGEAETRALIRIRHQMDDVFQSTTKKRGVKDMYVQVAERLYAEGGGEVSAEPNGDRHDAVRSRPCWAENSNFRSGLRVVCVGA